MEKYFDIHVKYDNGEADGYSIPVIAENKEKAKIKAVVENLFEYEDDVWDVNSITEITKEEYDRLLSA